MTQESRAPAGWYTDPYHPGQQRWWDGQAWGPEAPPRPKMNGAGITSLVIGLIVFIATMFVYSEFAVILAVVGLAFGILGAVRFRQDRRSRKAAWIAGLVLNAAVIVLTGIALTS